MSRAAPLLFIVIVILSSCSPQDASPAQGDVSSTTPASIDPTKTEAGIVDPPDLPSTSMPEPSEVPTLVAEPTDVLEIPHISRGQPATITSIHMIDQKTGWAIGGIDVAEDHIFFTEDGGYSWTDRTPPEFASPAVGDRKTASVFFLDENMAWVRYLDSTVIWRTNDGGLNWDPGEELDVDIRIPADIAPSSLQFISPQIGWVMIYLESGMSHDWIVLYQTKDGGHSWELLLHPSENPDLMGCCKTGLRFYDADTGIVSFGIGPYTAPHFSLTLDGGRTWSFTPLDVSQIGSPTSEFTDCEAHSPHLFDPNSIVLGMSCTTYSEPIEVSSYIYSSDDGGEAWSFDTYPGGVLYFLNQQIGWALGREIYRTTDGGVSWSWMSNVNWDAQFSFINENQGWAVAQAGEETGLVMTEDGGKTWTLLEPKVGS